MLDGYEKAVKEIIPAARLLIAKELKNRYNLKETDIASRLSVAQAAVSKYLKNGHSKRVENTLNKIDVGLVDRYIDRIAEGKSEYTKMCICTICNKLNKFGCEFSSVR